MNLWKLVAIAVGRLALKLQKLGLGLWAAVAVALGRAALKSQSFLFRAWAFFATTLGWTVLALGRLFRARGRHTLGLLVVAALPLGGLSYATTYVVLFDATGSEQGRLEATAQKVLSWADPSPQRSLLKRGDHLIVIPIQAPGNLDPTYSALFNATYPATNSTVTLSLPSCATPCRRLSTATPARA